MIDEIRNRLFSDVLENNRIKIPVWAKKVKIDVGTSLNAPNSEYWLNDDPELCVFGFEPNIYNIQKLYSGQHQWPLKFTSSKIGKSFFCINCALSNVIREDVDFYCTDDVNSGTSSLFKPKQHVIKSIEKVTVIRLSDFFDIFPWDVIPHIDQVKIDAQSADFDIVKGMGDYLSDRVVYLDVEATTGNQYYNQEDGHEFKNYIESRGFECLEWSMNGRFRNLKYQNSFNDIKYTFAND